VIVTPVDWATVGQRVEITHIGDALLEVIGEIECNDLSFSGGIDSSLLLYHMLRLGRKVRTFTMGLEAGHPDIAYARIALDYFERQFGVHIDKHVFVFPDEEEGNPAVARFYNELAHYTGSIIAGDGIDEYMAGYYAHQKELNEEVYYDYLYRLQEEHLGPLNHNSGNVEVHLPYIDKRLVHLLSQVPLCEKVDSNNRKKLMIALAQDKLPVEIIQRKKYGFCTKGDN